VLVGVDFVDFVEYDYWVYCFCVFERVDEVVWEGADVGVVVVVDLCFVVDFV